MAKNAVETMIRNTAKNKLSGKYNFVQYREGGVKYDETKKAILHKRICEEVVAFADSHKDIPFYFILSVGISKGAYKASEFEKGYKQFNAAKVETVHEMGAAYNAYNGIAGRKMSDVTIRLVMRFYEKVSTSLEDFNAALEKSQKLGKSCGERGNYEALCKNLNIPIKEKEEVAVAEQDAEQGAETPVQIAAVENEIPEVVESTLSEVA